MCSTGWPAARPVHFSRCPRCPAVNSRASPALHAVQARDPEAMIDSLLSNADRCSEQHHVRMQAACGPLLSIVHR